MGSYFISDFLFQSLDDGPFRNPLETMAVLDHAFLDGHDQNYQNIAMAPSRPTPTVVRSALINANTPDEPGMFEESYAESEEELEEQVEAAINDSMNRIASDVTSPSYVMPRRIRLRVPSGPYRVLTKAEKETMKRYICLYFLNLILFLGILIGSAVAVRIHFHSANLPVTFVTWSLPSIHSLLMELWSRKKFLLVSFLMFHLLMFQKLRSIGWSFSDRLILY